MIGGAARGDGGVGVNVQNLGPAGVDAVESQEGTRRRKARRPGEVVMLGRKLSAEHLRRPAIAPGVHVPE
jgi:hypothetical protein